MGHLFHWNIYVFSDSQILCRCERLWVHWCLYLILRICSHTGITWMACHVTSVGSFMSIQIARCWAFVVTLGATEWFTTSVGSFVSLQSTWTWAFVVTLGATEWLVTSVGSFMSSMHLMLSICSHTANNWRVYHQCGSFHEFSNHLMLSICSHTGSS